MLNLRYVSALCARVLIVWVCVFFECVWFQIANESEWVRDQVKPKIIYQTEICEWFSNVHFNSAALPFIVHILQRHNLIFSPCCFALCLSLARECVCMYEYENIIWLLQFQPQIAHCTKTHSPFIHSLGSQYNRSHNGGNIYTFCVADEQTWPGKMNCTV